MDYGYDSAGRLDTIKIGLTAFADYDYFGGRVTKRTMPNDLVTNYTHDGLGRLITISSTKGSPAVEVDA
ncbi:MAG: RHS repeat domain-containing protein, partial [Phycisphaerae bacterium]